MTPGPWRERERDRERREEERKNRGREEFEKTFSLESPGQEQRTGIPGPCCNEAGIVLVYGLWFGVYGLGFRSMLQ